MAKRKKPVTYIFPVITWDDVEGKDVWVGDVESTMDDPFAAWMENESGLIARLESELGQSVYVVRSLES